MIVQPNCSLLRPVRVVTTEDYLPESQSVRLEQSHEPTEQDEAEDLHECVVVGWLWFRETRHRLDLRHACVGSKGSDDAAVDIR